MHEAGMAAETDRPPATVVVCTHDRPELLLDCLASIASSMAPGDELIVAESGDSSAAGAVSGLGVAARLISSADPAKSAKLNSAVRQATTAVIIVTDDDCRVADGWIPAMAGAVAQSGVGIAFGPVEGLDAAPGGAAAARLPPGPAPIENWNFAHGASMAVRTDAVRDVGGFDERLGPGRPTHGEEADLVVRLAARGWGCVVADAPAVTHLPWRDDRARLDNLLVYERGAGAWLGAGLRRDPRGIAKLFVLRLWHQFGLWRDRGSRGPWFGPRTTVAFLAGVLRGLTYRPRRWI